MLQNAIIVKHAKGMFNNKFQFNKPKAYTYNG